MTRRYYVPELPQSGGLVDLSDTEAQHAIKVMRVAIGDQVVLFDGRGCESAAKVTGLSRKACQCTAEVAQPVDRELNRWLHLAIALPKPDRGREMIQRLTEIGVSKVTPLVAQRSQRAPTESTIDKLRRAVIEASKQCGRNQLLEIGPVVTTADFFTADHPGHRWVAHPGPDSQPMRIDNAEQPLVAAIGPEGGFCDQEVQLAIDNGFRPIHFGSRIFRVETAAVVVASVASVRGKA